MAVISLSKENFKENVLESSKVALVDFYADWCGPCKMMAPVVAAIAEENPQLVVGKVNTDEQQALAEEYSIFSIPTLMIFKDGALVDKQVGACSKDMLMAKLDQYK